MESVMYRSGLPVFRPERQGDTMKISGKPRLYLMDIFEIAG